MAHGPCKNPNCSNEGRPHPNCHCYADGGAVDFCSENRPHTPGCEYFAGGGAAVVVPDDVNHSIGLSALHHGLSGLLKKVGHTKLEDSDRHAKVLHEAREQNKWREAPNELPLKKTVGNRLGDKLLDRDHEGASELMHGHPMVGGMGKNHLRMIMERMAGPMLHQEPNPEGLRNAADYLHSTIKGNDELKSHMASFVDAKGGSRIEPDETRRGKIRDHLEKIAEDPSSLLEVGGSLGHYLPDHALALSSHAAQAANYLNSLKPAESLSNPLDTPAPADKSAEAKYHRQLDIAEKPSLILQHMKDGTLQPQDLVTLQTLYPGLQKAIVQKTTEQLIDAKTKGTEIPYKQKQALSMLLGQPLDSTMTTSSMQAIMKANGTQQLQNQQKATPGGKSSKPTAAELKAIEKTDAMYQTPLEARLMNKNEK